MSRLIFVTIAYALKLACITNPQLASAVELTEICPLNFVKISNSNSTICIKFKEKEIMDEKYLGCNHNAPFSLKIDQLDAETEHLLKENNVNFLWADMIRAYSYGPFINWNIEGKTMGTPVPLVDFGSIDKIPTENYNCGAFNIVAGKIIFIRCDSKIHRVCSVKPINPYNLTQGPCKQHYFHRTSPTSSCLTEIYTDGHKGFTSGTWNHTKDFCNKLSGNLINNGLIYTESLLNFKQNMEFPIDLSKINNFVTNNITVPSSMDTSGKYHYRDSDYVYHAAICEHPINRLKVKLHLFTKENMGIVLEVEYLRGIDELNVSLGLSDVLCFTDALKYYPVKLNMSETDNPAIFKVEYAGYGHYWCLIVNMLEFEPYESEDVFFTHDLKSLTTIRKIHISISIPITQEVRESKDLTPFYSQQLQNSSNGEFNETTNSYNCKLKDVYWNSFATFHANVTDSDFDQFSINYNMTGIIHHIGNYTFHGAIGGFVIADYEKGKKTCITTTVCYCVDFFYKIHDCRTIDQSNFPGYNNSDIIVPRK